MRCRYTKEQKVVTSGGFEPPTCKLKVCCCFQLSYEAEMVGVAGLEPAKVVPLEHSAVPFASTHTPENCQTGALSSACWSSTLATSGISYTGTCAAASSSFVTHCDFDMPTSFEPS